MTSPATISEAHVHDGRLVRPDDLVQLLPASLMADKKDGENAEYFAEKHFNSVHEWLGDGPFTITRIGQWPCGNVILYLKGAKTDNPGCSASDFM